MTKLTLKHRLKRFLTLKEVLVSSGEIQRLVAEKTSYSPQNVGRRLRELENEGVIEVSYKKGHAWYRVKTGQTMEEWFNSLPSSLSTPPSSQELQG